MSLGGILKSDYIYIILIILAVLIVTSGYLPAFFSAEDYTAATHSKNEDTAVDDDYTRYFLTFYDGMYNVMRAGEFPIWNPNHNIAIFGHDLVGLPLPICFRRIHFSPEDVYNIHHTASDAGGGFNILSRKVFQGIKGRQFSCSPDLHIQRSVILFQHHRPP